MSDIVLVFSVWSEGGLVEGIQDVGSFESVLAGDRFDIAIVAGVAEAKGFKNREGFGMALFHVPDDHVAADQLIESKHYGPLSREC